VSNSEKDHAIKAELIERLKPFYAPDDRSPLELFLDRLKHPFGHGHHHIDLSTYQHKPLADYSESQIVDRTVFALKKIKEFNHHFFTERELEVLNPQAMGLIQTVVVLGCSVFNAALFTILYRNRHFNTKTAVLIGGLLATEYVIARTPNTVNEFVQGFRRKNLATKYLGVYGPEFFHKIIDPRYDIEHLRHLHNKVHIDQEYEKVKRQLVPQHH